MRNFQTSAISRDIDTAAKFIGAGAATVGVAGSGKIKKKKKYEKKERKHFFKIIILIL